MVQKWSILGYPVHPGETNQWERWASRAKDFDTLGLRWWAAWLPCRLYRPAWVPLGCSIGAQGGFNWCPGWLYARFGVPKYRYFGGPGTPKAWLKCSRLNVLEERGIANYLPHARQLRRVGGLKTKD